MQTLKIVGLLLIGFIFSGARMPWKPKDKTNWISLEDALKESEKEKRPILIDLYTDWCGWCKVMDKKTYSNKNVSSYLAGKFYTVKFNAEGRDPVSWKGQSFQFNSRYKTHDFAIYLTNGQLSYPTTVILPADGSGPQAIPGYLEPKDFEVILKYFGEGHYGKIPFPAFHKQFRSSW